MKTTTLVIVAAAGAAAYLLMQGQGGTVSSSDGQTQDEGIVDQAQTAIDEAIAAVGGTGPVDGFSTSQSMLDMLQRREKLSLQRYALGDGGYTWGYGHFSKDPNALPAMITMDQAESIFANDVVNRGEKWVKLYVTVPLSQNQFDALVSIAFNMSPQSFKKFAASVNAGNGIDDIAQQSVSWVQPQFTNGIQNRRDEELAVFNQGVYA